jgi:hypothetical protein
MMRLPAGSVVLLGAAHFTHFPGIYAAQRSIALVRPKGVPSDPQDTLEGLHLLREFVRRADAAVQRAIDARR